MIRSAIAPAALPALALPALAEREVFDDKEAALAGAINTAEEPCELDIGIDAMFAWFDERIPADEAAEFASNANMLAAGAAYEIGEMSLTQKQLHCRAIKAKAADAGWLK